MAPIKASGAFLLLTASLLLSLAAAYPHRAYHDDADVQAPEKNVRHIDGLGAQQRAEEAMRQLQDQVKAQGGGSGTGTWSVRYSEYSSGSRGGEAGASGASSAPVRATITGEAIEGADGVIGVSTNCRNCRMRIRKVGGVSAGEYAGEQSVDAAGAGAGLQQLQSSQSSQRYYSSSSRSEGGQGQAGQAGYGGAHGHGTAYGSTYGGGRSEGALGGSGSGSSSSRVVQSSRVVESSGYGGSSATRPEYGHVDAAALGGLAGSSSRKDTRVTKSSWQLADLGYGTTNIEDLIRRLDDDMRAGRFQNGKTVTTVTTTTSENGSPPVTRQETFVKDGVVDVAALPGAPELAAPRPFAIGHSEVEDLLKGLREDLREGKTQAGKTVTTVVESSSTNGGPPVVTKNTYVRDGFDTSALDAVGEDATRLGLGSGQLDLLGHSAGGGSRSVSKTTHSTWSSRVPAPEHVDSLGGGYLLRTHINNASSISSYGTEGSTGGGHLSRDAGTAGGYGAGARGTYSAGSTVQETRRVDTHGGSHRVSDTEDYGASRGSGSQSQYGSNAQSQYGSNAQSQLGSNAQSQHGSNAQSQYGSSSSRYGASSSRYGASSTHYGAVRETDSYGQPTQETLSVTQMPGYRKEDSPVVDDAGGASYGSTSKYYSTFQSGGYTGGATDGVAAGQQVGVADGAAVHDASRTASSSSTYKRVTYSSSGSSGVAGDVQRPDVGGNSAFIAAEQSGGRIPEAASDSYFAGSSSHQRTTGLSGVNPAAPTGTVVVPVRGTASSSSSSSAYGSRTEWSDVQESRDDDFPALGPATAATPSIKLGYGTGNGGYGGPPAAAPANPDARGGKLSVSLMDIGILPPGSSSTQQQQVSQSGGAGGAGYAGASEYSSSSRYSSSSYGSSGSGHGATGSGYGATGSGYGATGSGYGATGSTQGTQGSGYGSVSGHGSGTRTYTRTYESSAPVSSHSSSWSSHSTYSSGTPSASGAEGVKGQRMTQQVQRVQRGPDCDHANA